MKNVLILFLVVLCSVGLRAQENTAADGAETKSIDQTINDWITPAASWFEGVIFYPIEFSETAKVPIVLIVLILGASFFTLFMGFINVRGFRHAIDVVRGVFTNPKDKGEVSHFQALTTALSATVGLGNIAGVAIAISIGGAGATFWMILAGLLGMSSKFVECTLGVKYREIDEHGVVWGGPMYYLSKGLEKMNMGKFGAFLAGFFAIACVGGSFGGGNMFQINQAYLQFDHMTGGMMPGWIFGLIVAIAVGIVIIGGIRSIARVTEKIVPFMCGIYVVAAVLIILANITEIGWAFGQILDGAFTAAGIEGGIIGVLIQGFKRAAFSNEAGVGSAAIAHSAVKTDEPVSEGIVALLEPFIDTVVVCTMTALVIIFTHKVPEVAPENYFQGILLTSDAFSTVFSFFPWILLIAVILFAYSTMISWSYYGLRAWTYLFGKGRVADLSYKLVFLMFVVIGAAASLGSVVTISDSLIFAMVFPNVIGLIIMAPEVKRDLASYLERVKSGAIKRFK